MAEPAVVRAVDFADIEDDAIRTSIDTAKNTVSLPLGYSYKGNGLYFDDGGDAGPQRIAGRIDVVAQTRDDHGASWGLLLNWNDDDGRCHQWAMPRQLLAGDGAEIRATLLDRGCYVAHGSRARMRLMNFLTTAVTPNRARAVERIGWVDGAFALPDRTIGDCERDRVIYQGPASFDHKFCATGTLEDWQNSVAGVAKDNSRLMLAIASAFVGPLLGMIGEEGGGINLRGPSSIGKSTALVAATSVWGPPSFLRQWRATANGLEGIAAQHSETFLALDELGQLDPKDAATVAYMLANGMGKARATRSGALRAPAQWRVMFLSSGELRLGDIAARDGRGGRSAAGQEVRILDVEADAGAGMGLFETLHGVGSAEHLARMIKDAASNYHGTAGPAFLEKVVANRDALGSTLGQGIQSFMQDNVPAGSDGQVARAARRFGIIAVAGELAVRLGILPWSSGQAYEAAGILFSQWLDGRGGISRSEDREAIARVRAFLESHGTSRFALINQSKGNEVRIINQAGFRETLDDGDRFLIFTETFRTDVCAGLNCRSVARTLAKHGYLCTDSAGKTSIVRALPGMPKASAPFPALLLLLASQIVIDRIPILPNRELLFVGVGIGLSHDLALSQAVVAGLLVAGTALQQLLHLLAYLATSFPRASRSRVPA